MWLYKGAEFEAPSENDYGFVYQLTNTLTGKKYIGKKVFWFKKIKTLKGKRKRYLAESDWKTYYGSSKSVAEDVKNQGEHTFTREILRLCKNKGECSYYEAKEQFDREVLLYPEQWYNDWIIARIHRKHIL
jgi:hypothetical protein